jgi:hypothetical protein
MRRSGNLRDWSDIENAVAEAAKSNGGMADVGLVHEGDFEDGNVVDDGGRDARDEEEDRSDEEEGHADQVEPAKHDGGLQWRSLLDLSDDCYVGSERRHGDVEFKDGRVAKRVEESEREGKSMDVRGSLIIMTRCT